MLPEKRVAFTKESYQSFSKRFYQAQKNKEEVFTFEGKEYVTLYAKVLLQYLRITFED